MGSDVAHRTDRAARHHPTGGALMPNAEHPHRRAGPGMELARLAVFEEGVANGAGHGGFGPEGNYGGVAGDPYAGALGQMTADRDPLAEQTQAGGQMRPDRVRQQ